MRRSGFIFLVLGLIAPSCIQKAVCPAYQSTFIYDKVALQKKFSYFKEDSTPKILTASTDQNKYLVAVPESYRKKFRSMQTVDMMPVYPVRIDSAKTEMTDDLSLEMGDSVAMFKADSIAAVMKAESGMVLKSPDFRITKTKEKYNNDQDFYMWFFRKTLLLPDIRYQLEKKEAGIVDPPPTPVAEKKRPAAQDSTLNKPSNTKRSLFKRKKKSDGADQAPKLNRKE